MVTNSLGDWTVTDETLLALNFLVLDGFIKFSYIFEKVWFIKFCDCIKNQEKILSYIVPLAISDSVCVSTCGITLADDACAPPSQAWVAWLMNPQVILGLLS